MTGDTRRFFVRDAKNPILRASDWPYPAHTVFNPGATLLPDGTTLLLCRVEERTGLSHLSAARSANGVDGWSIDDRPTLPADPTQRPEELWGVEDPRISFLPELDRYAITYTAFSQSGPGVALALTKDFHTFEHRGLVIPPLDKNAAILPRRIGGRWAMLHRPSQNGRGDVWMSFSPDLRSWGERRVVLAARRGGFWDAEKIGLSPPPLETKDGWLTLYHGVRRTASGSIYRVGAALFDRERPDVCIARGGSWVLGPEAPYEIDGDVPRVVFPCGMTSPDGEALRVYYGAADSSIGLAHGRVSELLAWLAEPENRVSRPAA